MSKTKRERTETKLRSHITALQEQIATRDASKQKPILQRKIDGLKSEQESTQERIAQLLSQLAEAVESRLGMKTELDKMKQVNTKLEEQVVELEEQVKQLEKDLDGLPDDSIPQPK